MQDFTFGRFRNLVKLVSALIAIAVHLALFVYIAQYSTAHYAGQSGYSQLGNSAESATTQFLEFTYVDPALLSPGAKPEQVQEVAEVGGPKPESMPESQPELESQLDPQPEPQPEPVPIEPPAVEEPPVPAVQASDALPADLPPQVEPVVQAAAKDEPVMKDEPKKQVENKSVQKQDKLVPKKVQPKKSEPKKPEPKKPTLKKPEAKKPEAKKPEPKKPEAPSSAQAKADSAKANVAKSARAASDSSGSASGSSSASALGAATGSASATGPTSSASHLRDEQGNFLRNPKPEYPQLSLQNREEGTVTLKVIVEPNGKPSRVELVKSSGYRRLDQAALKVVRQRYTFSPAKRLGQPIRSEYTFKIDFKLR